MLSHYFDFMIWQNLIDAVCQNINVWMIWLNQNTAQGEFLAEMALSNAQ